MKSVSYNYEIPFTYDMGGFKKLVPYADKNNFPNSWQTGKWVKNYIFEDTMQILDYGKGRSSVTFTLKSQTDGSVYYMFLSDMFDLISRQAIDKGMTPRLKWSFVKKGANYGIAMLESDKP